MLDFSDKPYRFFAPRPNRIVAAIVSKLNRTFVLPGRNHRIKKIELRHADRVLPVIKSGASCLLLPNHSTHSDPQMMFEVQRRLRIQASTMAAYDVFLRGKLAAWMMQCVGCFSVDREGSDKLAMNCAVETLVEGKRALTIFPEGNVLLMNDRVAPFLGGAAFIGMRAQKKRGADAPVYALPISMKYSHLTDVEPAIHKHMDELESQLKIDVASDTSLRKRMRAIGLEILGRNLRQRDFVPPANEVEDLNSALNNGAMQIVEKLEKKIEIEAKAGQSPIERIRKIRAAIHQIRIDETQQLDHRVASSWADEAILAMRILSYSGDYLRESPTLDRHGETLEKFREDLSEKIVRPLGDRSVVVQFGQPINLADALAAKNSRQALNDLTTQFEQAVQEGLDEINATNTNAGARSLE